MISSIAYYTFGKKIPARRVLCHDSQQLVPVLLQPCPLYNVHPQFIFLYLVCYNKNLCGSLHLGNACLILVVFFGDRLTQCHYDSRTMKGLACVSSRESYFYIRAKAILYAMGVYRNYEVTVVSMRPKLLLEAGSRAQLAQNE